MNDKHRRICPAFMVAPKRDCSLGEWMAQINELHELALVCKVVEKGEGHPLATVNPPPEFQLRSLASFPLIL